MHSVITYGIFITEVINFLSIKCTLYNQLFLWCVQLINYVRLYKKNMFLIFPYDCRKLCFFYYEFTSNVYRGILLTTKYK